MNGKWVVSLLMVAAVGALAAALLLTLELEPLTRTSALAGAALSTVLGAVVLFIKAALLGRANGLKDLKVQLGSMGASFGLRLLGIGAGVLWLRRMGLPYEGFLLTFFVCYLAQQVIEVRYVLRAAVAVATPEVGR